jgi:hypothetical protein
MAEQEETAITFRCDGEMKRRAKVGAGRRDQSLSEYLRTLIIEDTTDIDSSVLCHEQSQ